MVVLGSDLKKGLLDDYDLWLGVAVQLLERSDP